MAGPAVVVTELRLTWNKRYITLAPIATVLGTAFKLSDRKNCWAGEKSWGIICADPNFSTPGVEIESVSGA